jgi:hypothetical protein
VFYSAFVLWFALKQVDWRDQYSLSQGLTGASFTYALASLIILLGFITFPSSLVALVFSIAFVRSTSLFGRLEITLVLFWATTALFGYLQWFCILPWYRQRKIRPSEHEQSQH